MQVPKVFEQEYKFCLIVWANEPITSSALAKLCKEKLGWSRTTTYTVIKRLSDRGVIQNKDTVVTSLVSKEDMQAQDLKNLMEDRFEGSLPAFLTAFSRQEKLSKEKIRELLEMIGEDDND